MESLPLVEELDAKTAPVEVFRSLAQLPHVVFFDSMTAGDEHARYSFVAADPFHWIARPADGSDALAELELALQPFAPEPIAELPPFQGGAAGLLSYDLAASLERIPAAKVNDLPVPALAVGLYDVVVAFDHKTDQAWIVSQGFPELESSARRTRAQARLEQIASLIRGRRSNPTVDIQPDARLINLARQYHVSWEGITSNLSEQDYLEMVAKAVEYIHAGDVFQVNLAQRLLCPAQTDSVDLYLRLRKSNPAPYCGYFDFGSGQICSTSPECFLTVREGHVETRPIKGTHGRFANSEADLYAGDALVESEKDRAENVMIVDLLRNDLSRVCLADSVHVDRLWDVETHAYVKHLVSTIRGKLADDKSCFDLLRACFPGGSISGAPKIRAMEIIAELEPTARGAYCGSLAYLGFDGQMDSSILIRTITASSGWWQFPVGGGIVAQSDPAAEYQESWQKARGMLQALKS